MPQINQKLSDITEDDMKGGWTAMPEGEYRFVIDDSEYKPTKAGNGMVLSLHCKCVEPNEHNGTEIRDFLTLEHPNPETVKIARARLKQYALATQHPNPDEIATSEELHNRVFLAVLGQEVANDPKYGDRNGMQNRIKYVKAPESGETATAGPVPSAPQAGGSDEMPAHMSDNPWD